jgi:general nucleoside transport system permease protein
MGDPVGGVRLPPHLARAALLLVNLAVAVALTAGIVALFGASPAEALSALVRGAVGSETGLTESLLEAIPLLLAGLGVALAFRAHLWNIGAEGQLLVGSLAAVVIGTRLPTWPAWLLLPAVLAAGATAGALWAGLAAALRVYRAVPEVIATIMLNFLALNLVSWAATGPLREPGQDIPRTRLLPEAALLPAVGGGGLHAGMYVALAAVAVVGVLLFHTPAGFRIRAVGQNPEASAAAGLPVARTLSLAFCLSGALAGLAGAVQLAGVTHRVYGGSSPGTGYTAVAVALVGGLHPAGVLLAALFFGGLVAGSNEMQRTAGVSSVIVSVIQGLVLLLLIAGPRARMRLPRGTEHEEALAADQRFDEEVTAERGQRGLASNSREEPR